MPSSTSTPVLSGPPGALAGVRRAAFKTSEPGGAARRAPRRHREGGGRRPGRRAGRPDRRRVPNRARWSSRACTPSLARPPGAALLGWAATYPDVRGSGAGLALTEGVLRVGTRARPRDDGHRLARDEPAFLALLAGSRLPGDVPPALPAHSLGRPTRSRTGIARGTRTAPTRRAGRWTPPVELDGAGRRASASTGCASPRTSCRPYPILTARRRRSSSCSRAPGSPGRTSRCTRCAPAIASSTAPTSSSTRSWPARRGSTTSSSARSTRRRSAGCLARVPSGSGGRGSRGGSTIRGTARPRRRRRPTARLSTPSSTSAETVQPRSSQSRRTCGSRWCSASSDTQSGPAGCLEQTPERRCEPSADAMP